MKKAYILLGAAAGLVLAGCSNNDIRNDIEEIEVPIDLELSIDKVTKAEQTTDLATIKTTGFGVYGSKTSSASGSPVTTTLFTNEKVSWSTDKWTYVNTKYWDKNATYEFYAIAPHKASGYSFSDGKFTITGVASGLASSSDDYIIDRDGATGISGALYGAAGTAVAFDFHHIMAKVDFKLLKSSTVADGDVLKVQSIKMSGWDNATGTFTQIKTDGTWDKLDVSEWELATKVAGEVEVITAETTLSKTASSNNTNTYIMVPQEIDEKTLTFTVSYTINDEPYTAHVGTIEAAQTWGTDSHVTYTLTIGPQAIKFNVSSVCGFCVEDPQTGTIE